MKEALYYQKLADDKVMCLLCPHQCKINPGERGICGVRENRKGTLYSLVYEKAIATHIDPIEKKPLFHVHPGSKSFSVATAGCNFSCQFCQNHEISQMPKTGNRHILGDTLSAENIVALALQAQCKTISCTYTEPTVYYEYALDIAKLAAKYEIDTIFVSNGYINQKPLQEAAPFLKAANIDLKGWDEDFYKNTVGGNLKHVLNTLKQMKKLNIWLEITTLVVPQHVDNEKNLKEIALFIKNELGPETPWHISRFYPNYKYQMVPPTLPSIIQRGREIGQECGLYYVYTGNIAGDIGEHSFCYKCGTKLIERYGFQILNNNINNGTCPSCGAVIHGIGM